MRKFAPFITIVMLLGLLLGGISQNQAAAQPQAQPQAQAQTNGKGYPLEGSTQQVKPAPYYATAPSKRVATDPHWTAPNVRVNNDTTTYAQQEPAVAVNPLNHLNVVAAQKDERRAPSQNTATKEVWIETSTDGGASWPLQTNIPMPDTTLPQQSDPVVTFSDNNNVFVTIIGYNQNNPTSSNELLVARSTNGGLTWPTPAVNVAPGIGGTDKEWTAIDLNPASPYYHRMYVTWTNFSAGPQFVEKWSSDSGVTWNPPGSSYVTVSYGGYDTGQFSMPVAMPNGNVIATWNAGSVIAVGKSTDGGQSFINPNTTAVNITNVHSVPGSNWRLSTVPATTVATATGTLVSVWADGRNGKDDIYFTRSTNGGTTWSAPTRVPHNAAGASYQVEPWVSVSPSGRFDVIWYDDRDFPSNLNTFHIYASHSTDDGVTWTGPDEQVTDAATNLNVGIPGGPGWNGAAGDYINVTSMDDYAYAVWTDTRSGTNEDIYSSRYSPAGGGTPTPTNTPGGSTNTPTSTATATSVPPTMTATSVPPTATATSVPPTATATSVPPTSTATSVPPTATATSVPATNTPRPATNTPGGPTNTPAPTNTPVPTNTPGGPTATSVMPTITPTDCPNPFVDINNNVFYYAIHYLYCRGVVNGTDATHYSPGGTSTRAQFAKVVVLGFGESLYTPSGGQDFTDVPPSYWAYVYIETGFHNGILSGFDAPSCTSHNATYPCYLPNLAITRGQLTKLVVLAGGYQLYTPTGGTQDFSDVPPSYVFYVSIETAFHNNIIAGYPDGTFRPNNNIRRDEMAQIVYEGIIHRP